jgi:hypothetical protein
MKKVLTKFPHLHSKEDEESEEGFERDQRKAKKDSQTI